MLYMIVSVKRVEAVQSQSSTSLIAIQCHLLQNQWNNEWPHYTTPAAVRFRFSCSVDYFAMIGKNVLTIGRITMKKKSYFDRNDIVLSTQCSTSEFLSVCCALDRIGSTLQAQAHLAKSQLTSSLLRKCLMDIPDLLKDIHTWSGAINEQAAKYGNTWP